MQPRGHFPQHLVAGKMAQAVVDLLEAIEVHEQYRQLCVVAAGFRGRRCHELLKGQSVGQAGQSVLVGNAG